MLKKTAITQKIPVPTGSRAAMKMCMKTNPINLSQATKDFKHDVNTLMLALGYIVNKTFHFFLKFYNGNQQCRFISIQTHISDARHGFLKMTEIIFILIYTTQYGRQRA